MGSKNSNWDEGKLKDWIKSEGSRHYTSGGGGGAVTGHSKKSKTTSGSVSTSAQSRSTTHRPLVAEKSNETRKPAKSSALSLIKNKQSQFETS